MPPFHISTMSSKYLQMVFQVWCAIVSWPLFVIWSLWVMSLPGSWWKSWGGEGLSSQLLLWTSCSFVSSLAFYHLLLEGISCGGFWFFGKFLLCRDIIIFSIDHTFSTWVLHWCFGSAFTLFLSHFLLSLMSSSTSLHGLQHIFSWEFKTHLFLF